MRWHAAPTVAAIALAWRARVLAWFRRWFRSNLGNVAFLEIPAYSRWDLRANWTSADKQWAVTGFVQNVLDKIGLREFLPLSTNGNQPMMGRLTEPRQFGVQVRWRPQF